MSVASLFSIDVNTPDTGWIDASWLTQDVAFNITGTWVGTIALDISNDPTPTTKTQYSSAVATYTANQAPLGLPRNIGSFFRFRRVAWTSGTAKIGFSNGVDGNGQVKPLSTESAGVNLT